jgi:redox-sensitive bicupin YhaK (pirin superfamily)
MGFRALRVINEDIIAPTMGFGMHGHRDMEIVTYLLSGSLTHRDSLGNGDVLRSGDVQRMSAGSGIRHSEFNPADDSTTHLLQIWLEPRQPGGSPTYEQRHFSREERLGRWCPIITSRASDTTNSDAQRSEGNTPPLSINSDVRIFACLLQAGQSLSYSFAPGRHGYLHLARGRMTNDLTPTGDSMASGDALRLSNHATCTITAIEPSEALLFDLV